MVSNQIRPPNQLARPRKQHRHAYFIKNTSRRDAQVSLSARSTEISPSTLANSESSCPKRRSAAVVGVATTNMHSRNVHHAKTTGDAQTTHDGIVLHFRCMVQVGSLSNIFSHRLLRRKPITRGASTRTPSNAAESPAHRNQASVRSSRKTSAKKTFWYSPRVGGSSWHVPKYPPQLARGSLYLLFPLSQNDCASSCEKPNDSLAWRIVSM